MTEIRAGFLCNIAASLYPNNETLRLLKSYYLIRCNELTKGYGLPAKIVSKKARCPHCFLEWTRDTEVKVRPVKYTKKQRKRTKSHKNKHNNNNLEKEPTLLRCNEMEQVCTFCKQSTKTKLMKPEKEYIKLRAPDELNSIKADNIKKSETIQNQKKPAQTKIGKSNTKREIKKCVDVNVYSNTFDVFSLKNEKNTLASAVKEHKKVIKNCKKKKDKFAGLCQKAVLASAKLKQQKEPQAQQHKSKLSMFLKSSSG